MTSVCRAVPIHHGFAELGRWRPILQILFADQRLKLRRDHREDPVDSYCVGDHFGMIRLKEAESAATCHISSSLLTHPYQCWRRLQLGRLGGDGCIVVAPRRRKGWFDDANAAP